MKKVICLIAGGIFALNIFAQSSAADMSTGTSEMWKDKFCAKKVKSALQESKLVIMHNDVEMTSDYTTSSGVKIKTDGTVIKKDGSKIMLKEGQCVNVEGNLEKKDNLKKESKEMKKEEPKTIEKY